MESTHSNKLAVTSYGIETARYNSLIHYEMKGKGEEMALLACGNRLVLFDFQRDQVLIDQKVLNDAIMVVTLCKE
jgi:hypothetical protein